MYETCSLKHEFLYLILDSLQTKRKVYVNVIKLKIMFTLYDNLLRELVYPIPKYI